MIDNLELPDICFSINFLMKPKRASKHFPSSSLFLILWPFPHHLPLVCTRLIVVLFCEDLEAFSHFDTCFHLETGFEIDGLWLIKFLFC